MTVSDDANDTQEESASVSVLIADDHPVMSTALRTYVDSSPGMRCIGEANNGEAAVSRALELRPDVVVMDLHMPGIGGIEATRRIRDEDPAISVLAVTTFSTERYVIPALRAGAMATS
ncbi:response regulator transcription factor [Nesterenkonia pannonica]|uniref:response regulator n=1 Tax=Nesterenkonia pannonica TaxID=1548602 RepID=UPI002164C320|nr:response regulator transcription factor [Nesterenkonia pannonica]